MGELIDIFIPSYHRAENLKTVNYFLKIGYDKTKLHIFIDSDADDKEQYIEECYKKGINLFIFSQEEAVERYDYIHRPSPARRSAGQARNMFYDYAKEKGIDFYCVQDDDTNNYEIKRRGKYFRKATFEDIQIVFLSVRAMMLKYKLGCFGISQTGDFIGGSNKKILRNKVMNTTFINTKYIYRGERGIQDNDTSQFASIMNEGLFTGSLADGLVLQQTKSATAKGGLTDLYNELKLFNKSMVVPIQYPSSVFAERQEKNGGRIHHNIKSKFLYPKIIKGNISNLAWNTYPEDYPFTNEPKRNK